ncbi:MAG: helix-turn-helix domain-containing protein [Patescibacteria group bacterium]
MIKAGQKLHDERKRKGLTLEQVASSTKIREEFLRAIERGEYGKLPSSSYAQGFVRSYTRFLNLPEKETLALFRREFAVDKDLDVLPEGLSGKKDIPIRKFKIHQVVLLGILIFILLIGYIFFQFRYAFINPPLEIENPKEMASFSSSTVTVSGKTDPAATVYIEDEVVPVNDDGSFKKEIVEFPGKTTITIKVVNRFGKETTLERHITIK